MEHSPSNQRISQRIILSKRASLDGFSPSPSNAQSLSSSPSNSPMGRQRRLTLQMMLSAESLSLIPEQQGADIDDDGDGISKQQIQKIKNLILIQPPPRKLNKVLDELQDLIARIGFFYFLNEAGGIEAIRRCCQEFELRNYSQSQEIYNEGDVCSEFYLLLDGAVRLTKTQSVESYQDYQEYLKFTNPQPVKTFIKKSTFKGRKDDDSDQKTDDITTPKNLDVDGKFKRRKGVSKTIQNPQQMISRRNFGSPTAEPIKYKKEIQFFDTPTTFGETSSSSKKKREYSAIAAEDSTVLCIPKKLLDQIIAEYEENLLKKRLGALKNIKIFATWGYFLLHDLFRRLKKQSYTRGQQVYKEGDISDKVYFVKDGMFKLTKVVPVSEKKGDKHMVGANSAIKKTVDIFSFGADEMVGEIEIIRDCPREFTLLCTSQTGVLYYLNKKFNNSKTDQRQSKAPSKAISAQSYSPPKKQSQTNQKQKYLTLSNKIQVLKLGWVTALTINKEENILYSGSEDKKIKVWDLNEKKLIYTFQHSHVKKITSLYLIEENTKMISFSVDQSFKIWDLKNKVLLHQEKNAYEIYVAKSIISKDQKYIITGESGGVLTIYPYPLQKEAGCLKRRKKIKRKKKSGEKILKKSNSRKENEQDNPENEENPENKA